MKRQTLPGFSAESSFDTTDGKYYENQSSLFVCGCKSYSSSNIMHSMPENMQNLS